MSRPKVTSCDIVPRTRAQRSIAQVWPVDATGYHAPSTPSQPITLHTQNTLGRFPTIGIDSGHIPHTRPDHLY